MNSNPTFAEPKISRTFIRIGTRSMWHSVPNFIMRNGCV